MLSIEKINNLEKENERLKEELQNFQDMAKKGLKEFKDVGGCWGCGLQLQLNQDMEDIKQLKAENEKLIESLGIANKYVNKYHQTLQEIKEIAIECTTCGDCCNCKYNEDCDTNLTEQALGVCRMILDLITKAEEE